MLFRALYNKHNTEDILCTYQGYLQLVYALMKAKPIIFAQINNVDLLKDLEEQDREVHPHWYGNDDESNSSF